MTPDLATTEKARGHERDTRSRPPERPRPGSLVASVLLALTLASCASTQPPERIEAGRLGQVVLFRPVRAPAGMVLLFSDEAGWSVAWNHTAEVIRTAGSHHFDGDYEALARRILDGLRRRSQERPPR